VTISNTPSGAPRKSVRRKGAAFAFLTPGTTVLLVFVAVPILLIVGYSFFQRGRFGGVVFTPTVDNFVRLIDPIYLGVIGNSIGTATTVTVLALLLGYPTAMVIARLPAKWRTIALIAILLPFWTNFLIRTYALILLFNNAGWINQALMGLGITEAPLSMLYTPQAVVVGLLYMYLPLMVLPLYSSLASQDQRLTEAAINLGATPFRVFRTITLPLSIPGALTGCIFVFVPAMSNFVIPELLGGGKTIMIGNLVRDQFLKARDWPFGAALALVLTIFLIVLLLVQNRVSNRLTDGPATKRGKKNA
jgi:spermidine/putrescine transport system permease protein